MKKFRNTEYYISEDGCVFRDGKQLKPYINKYGYKQIGITIDKYRKTVQVHRLVAECYIPNPENKTQVNHKDGNKINNNISNLEWNTHSENQKHSYKTKLNLGTIGEINGMSKLTKENVLEIRKSNKTKQELIEQFGVSRRTIERIIKKQLWKHI